MMNSKKKSSIALSKYIFTSTLIYSNRSHWSLSNHTSKLCLSKKKSTKGSKNKSRHDEGEIRESQKAIFFLRSLFILSFSQFIENERRKNAACLILTHFFSFPSYPRFFFFHQNCIAWENDFHSLNAKVRNFFHPIARQANIWDGKTKFFFLFSLRYIINMIFSRKFDAT